MVRLAYKQKERGKLWNTIHSLKRVRFAGVALRFSFPKPWLRELGLEKKDLVLLTLDAHNKQIIIQKADPTQYNIPKEETIQDAEVN